MLFQNILVPYDGSSFSHRAFKVALDISQHYKSKVTVVWYIDTYSVGWFEKPSDTFDILHGVHKDRQQKLSKLENIAKEKGVKIKSKIIESASVAKPLVSFAKSKKIDLIVMGAHGHSGLDRFFLGSVSNSVMQRARCPVLIIK